MAPPPGVVVLGGPNGAGKSTAAPRLLRGSLRVEEFVNADTLAQGLSAFRPQDVALEAGRITLARLDSLESQRKSFAFESTLASHALVRRLRRLKKRGYSVHVVYLWLPTVDLALARVAERVRTGGHDVPAETVRRRFDRERRNFFTLYRPLAEHVATLRCVRHHRAAARRDRRSGRANEASRSKDVARSGKGV